MCSGVYIEKRAVNFHKLIYGFAGNIPFYGVMEGQ